MTDKLGSNAAARRRVMPVVEHRAPKAPPAEGENRGAAPKARAGRAGLRSRGGLQRFVAIFSAVRNLFVPPRSRRSPSPPICHRLNALAHCERLSPSAPQPEPVTRPKCASPRPPAVNVTTPNGRCRLQVNSPLRGIPSTSDNTGSQRSLRGGKSRQCALRHASRQHNAVFSSDEWCLRVARRMSLIVFFAADVCGPVFLSISLALEQATMSRKSSLLNQATSVSRALMSDSTGQVLVGRSSAEGIILAERRLLLKALMRRDKSGCLDQDDQGAAARARSIT